jgi:hypothetical protein
MDRRMCFRVGLTVCATTVLCGQSFQSAFAQVPEENRKQVVEALGTPFIVFRDKVLDELKVTDDQREKLMEYVMGQIMETGPFLDSLNEAGPDREKKLNEHRKQALEKLGKRLKEVLEPEQMKRLRQITLQQEGDLSLVNDDVRKELKITPEQMKKFMAIMQDLQKNIEDLVTVAQAGGNPEGLRAKVEQARKDHASKLQDVLTDDQKKKWKELLGPPFALGD